MTAVRDGHVPRDRDAAIRAIRDAMPTGSDTPEPPRSIPGPFSGLSLVRGSTVDKRGNVVHFHTLEQFQHLNIKV